MSSQIHLENFIESTAALPAELVRLLATIRDLDERSQSAPLSPPTWLAAKLLALLLQSMGNECRSKWPSEHAAPAPQSWRSGYRTMWRSA